MALNPIRPGLRALWLNAASPAKVAVVVAPNDVLHVSDDLAAQLQRGDSHFREVDADFVPPSESSDSVAAAGDVEDAELVDIEPAAKPRARKPKA